MSISMTDEQAQTLTGAEILQAAFRRTESSVPLFSDKVPKELTPKKVVNNADLSHETEERTARHAREEVGRKKRYEEEQKKKAELAKKILEDRKNLFGATLKFSTYAPLTIQVMLRDQKNSPLTRSLIEANMQVRFAKTARLSIDYMDKFFAKRVNWPTSLEDYVQSNLSRAHNPIHIEKLFKSYFSRQIRWKGISEAGFNCPANSELNCTGRAVGSRVIRPPRESTLDRIVRAPVPAPEVEQSYREILGAMTNMSEVTYDSRIDSLNINFNVNLREEVLRSQTVYGRGTTQVPIPVACIERALNEGTSRDLNALIFETISTQLSEIEMSHDDWGDSTPIEIDDSFSSEREFEDFAANETNMNLANLRSLMTALNARTERQR